jgi:hypothetical protein
VTRGNAQQARELFTRDLKEVKALLEDLVA